MNSIFEILFVWFLWCQCVVSFHEQYRVPHTLARDLESYVFRDKEYVLQNFAVTWENAKIICKGHYNGSLAVLDTKEKAEFVAEALSESQFLVESVWLGARRDSAEDPEGYRWGHAMGLRRTAIDVLSGESDFAKHYPLWLNRTHVPVPEGGADCVALERVYHDKPVFVDLPCSLERAFVCEREARQEQQVSQVQSVRCRTGVYRVFDGRLDWHEAAAYCVLRKMALANIGTMRCLKKLGLTMLKSRPSIENAWVGARGSLGKWWWVDSGTSIFAAAPYSDVPTANWPPMRDRNSIKSDGCLQLDRHAEHPPVFLEARCERKMQFICYQSAPELRTPSLPSDDNYFYILIRQLYEWQQAYDNCNKMNGSLAFVDNNDRLIQLLLVMGENNDAPIDHIWIAGKLNMSRDPMTDAMTISWMNPINHKRIPDSKKGVDTSGAYVPPWLDEDFTMDSPCLNLDREDHLHGLMYGMPCETPQASICMIEKVPPKQPVTPSTEGESTIATVGPEDNRNGQLKSIETIEKATEETTDIADGYIENKDLEIKEKKSEDVPSKDRLNGIIDNGNSKSLNVEKTIGIQKI